MAASLKALISKLNDRARNGLEAAAGLAVTRTHYDIEIEHYFLKILDQPDNDVLRIFRHYDVDISRITKELTRSVDRLKTGNARTPGLSPSLVSMLTEAWTLGSLDYNTTEIRTGFTVLALTTVKELSRILEDVSREWQKIEGTQLRKDLLRVLAGSPEDRVASAVQTTSTSPAAQGVRAPGKTPNLDQFTINLTERAREGQLDPVLGRDFEIRQVIDILTRRRQNNPILTGEAGVGKTAVVEGFALRVVAGDVPDSLRKIQIRTLDLALLQAGAGVRGEFENRLKGLIEEVKASPIPIILFIDEAHTMVGAGGQAGQGDAANLLKPALARGELRTIAATTWSEYKKYFEKDAALARRFQVIKVEEPNEATCKIMLRGVVSSLEKHHRVRILDEAITAAVRLSDRYISGRQLPDKAVSVLDTACARLALSQNTIPAQIEAAHRRLDDLSVLERLLRRESAVGADHTERLAALEPQRDSVQATLSELNARFEKEKNLVLRIRELRATLEGTLDAPAAMADHVVAQPIGAGSAVPEYESVRSELEDLTRELTQLQGDTRLMGICVDHAVVSEVISDWTGIPTGKMVKDEIQSILNLEEQLRRRVVGQDHALEAISERLRISKASLEDPNKPIGVFLLVGPSGVGKTETALALADLFYGGERNLITINMSEFQEAHTVSTLKGSPPGYVGYGEGGVLTEAVRRKPYSVVLLDEVEKAHPDVLELFFQVFDKGHLEDGEGRGIDFKNTINILTTNAATDRIAKLAADPSNMPAAEEVTQAIKPELNRVFKPAFLGRLVVVPYFPVRDEVLKQIVRLKLSKIVSRIQENHRIALHYEDAVVDEVAIRCTEVESGARNVDNILTNTLLPDISRLVLEAIAEGRTITEVKVTADNDGAFIYSFDNDRNMSLAAVPTA